MREGEPKSEEVPQTQEIQEPQNEKRLKWQEAEQQLEKFTGIDEGIKETVVGLNVFGVETVNSCEGHYNHGRIAPWVSMEKWESKPRERFIGQKEFEQQVYERLGVVEINQRNSDYIRAHDEMAASFLPEGQVEFDKLSIETRKQIAERDEELMKKYGITSEVTKQWMDAGMQAEKEVEQAGKDGRLQETEEYKKWKAENDAMKDNAQGLLDEFYKGRKNPQDARIVLDQDGMGMWCIHNGGKDYYDVTRRQEDIPDADKKHYQEILDGKNSETEQKEIEARVDGYRAEFQEFAKFCKEKYLGKNEAREISPELVKEVENSGFPAEEKVYILLVKAGLKPAAHVSFNARVYGHGRDDRRVPEDVTKASAEMIEKSGLFYKREEGKDDGLRMGFTLPDGTDVEYDREHISYLIAHTQQDLDKVKLASDQESDELMGAAFGYPKTAVEAYSKKEFLDLEKLPEKIRKSPAMLFCRFKLSANNWEEELRQVQGQVDFVKKNSPKIYKEIIKEGINLERTREKERIYDKIKEKVEQIPGIEKGTIKITTILNVLDVSTSQSCEGHVSYEESETRIVVPHVEWSAPNQPEKRFVGQEKLVQKVAQKYGVPAEDVRTTILHNAHWEEFKNAKETEKYKAWRKETKKIAKRGGKFLQEFNKDNAAPEHIQLILNEQESGHFDISNRGGRQGWQSFGEKDLTPEQRAETNEQLAQYQRQMDDFAEFLKEKYFTSK